MPRQTRKRTLLNPQKSQLLFVEQPRNGPRHCYGQQLRSAINPMTFVSEGPRQSIAVSSWVSPQFTSLEDTAVRRGGRGRKKNRLPANTINTASILSLPQVRRNTACKYSALTFETSTSIPQRQRQHKALCKKTASCAGETQKAQSIRLSQSYSDKTVSPNNQNEVPAEGPRQTPLITTRRQITATSEATVTHFRTSEMVKTPLAFTVGKRRTAGFVHTPSSKGNYTPDTSTVFTPPHIETPEMAHSEHCRSSSVLHLLFSPSQSKTPPRTQSLGLLVKDTPERDYGLKVTWRRRKNLMKLLTERGQLLVSEAMISNQ
ncbi:RAD9, HUS1, RAD1-interacting nuclear orphan protein 1 [Colossoma macropomum]|uniref:RAD9, HUS1, RAD1-interacting nuclear orphan protein 1 n=1 Tax=Colossoma macropomum TaxID=42526 RepID=UPI0018640492|nr:RAD9, HUS1, RAD1-interacting nuclear orphan protein 1 [Colossoma macropomum]